MPQPGERLAVVGIGHHRPDPREAGAETGEPPGPGAWARAIGRCDPAGDHQPEKVDEQVGFAALEPLMAVESPNASAFGRLDRLAVQDDPRRADQAATAEPRLGMKGPLQLGQDARLLPGAKGRVNATRAREQSGARGAPGTRLVAGKRWR